MAPPRQAEAREGTRHLHEVLQPEGQRRGGKPHARCAREPLERALDARASLGARLGLEAVQPDQRVRQRGELLRPESGGAAAHLVRIRARVRVRVGVGVRVRVLGLG